jgi:hypothetical protein
MVSHAVCLLFIKQWHCWYPMLDCNYLIVCPYRKIFTEILRNNFCLCWLLLRFLCFWIHSHYFCNLQHIIFTKIDTKVKMIYTLTQIMYYLLNAEDQHVFGFLSANDNVTSKSLCPLWFQHCSRCTYPLWPPYSQRKIKFSKILHGTVKTILSFIISLPIIAFEYGPIVSNCNISYEGKEIDLNFCKIKFFHVFIPKQTTFVSTPIRQRY